MGEQDSKATEAETDAETEGPLSSLYDNKYKDIFLQWPLNVESAEESHWVRFDINEITGTQIKQDEKRTVSFGGAGGSGGGFLDRIVSGTAEKATALVTTALMAPVNIAKSTVNEFLNDLPPVLGGIGRDFLGGFSGKSKSRGMGSIMLYAPHTRQENLKLNWGPDKLGQVGAAVAAGGGTVGGALSDVVTGESETVNSVIQNRTSLAQGALSKLAGSALGGNAKAIVNQTFKSKGQAINPHMEMFFDNIDFRAFTFDFKLAPRNASEAKAIREIINLFKYAATPAYDSSPGGVFFRYPNVFEITFFNENETHKIATSCLTAVNVNYTGPGINSTFYDNYPVETHLNLTFTELEIMHKGKIDEGY